MSSASWKANRKVNGLTTLPKYCVESSIRISWAEGEMKGKIERNLEVALEMIRDGESNDKIRKYTGLTDDEIEKLRGEV